MQLDISLEKIEIVAKSLEDCEKKLRVLWEKMADSLEEFRKLRNRELFPILRELEREKDQLGEEIRRLQRRRLVLEQIERQYRRTEEGIQDFEEEILCQPEFYVLHELEQVTNQLKEWGIVIK